MVRTFFPGRNGPGAPPATYLAVGALFAARLLAAAEVIPVQSEPDALFQRAQVVEKELEQAKSDMERESLLLGLAKIYRDMRRYDRAIDCYERIRSLDSFPESPNRQSVLYQLGLLYETRGHHGPAIDAYREYLAPATGEATGEERVARHPPTSPGDHQIQRRLVSVLSEAGRPEEAKQLLFEMAGQEQVQQSAYALSRLVTMYEQGLLGEAELGEVAEPLLAQLPGEAARLAKVLVQRGRPMAARYFYDELLENNPGVLLSVAEAVAHFYQGQDALSAVIEEMEKAEALTLDRLRLLIRFHRVSGEMDRAVALMEAKLEEQEIPGLVRELGDLRMARGEYLAAAEAYERYAQRAGTPDPEVYRSMGEAYLLAGEEERAVDAWDRIPEALGNSARAYQTAGEIFDQYGFADRAVAYMEEAVARSPHSSFYVPQLLNLYLKHGRFHEAIAQLVHLAGSVSGLERVAAESILGAAETPEVEAKLLEAAQAAAMTAPPKSNDILLDIIFQIRLRAGQFDEAIEEIKRIPGARGEQRLYVLGQSLRDFGEAEAAAKALTAIAPPSPYYAAARIEAVNALVETGERDRALGLAADCIRQITGGEAASAAVRDASTDLFAVLSSEIARSVEWGAGKWSDLERLLVSLGELWVREKDGRRALAALLATQQIPTQGRAVKGRSLLRETLLMGHGYALLGDHRSARLMYQTACQWSGPSQDEARYMLAELDLWDGEAEEAKAAYEELVRQDLSRSVINDALERMYFLAQLGPEEIRTYAQAARHAWQGRWEEAADRYRTLAAGREGDHVADWCLFEIGKIRLAEGKFEAAREEWERLLEKTENVSLRGRIRLSLLEMEAKGGGASPEQILEGYRSIIDEMPETIFADEARRRLSGS